MGLASWLLDLGVRVEETVGKFGVRTGHVPLQWTAGQDDQSLIHRLTRDAHERASMFASAQSIVVNPGEAAVVLEDGKPYGVLEPGVYRFERARVTGILDVIWLKTGQKTMKWGVGNVTSADGIQIGANGVAYVRIEDGVRFVPEVVQGSITLTDVDLQRFLMPRMQGVLRTVIAQSPALALQTQRTAFTTAIRENLASTMFDLGLALVDFEVVEISFPPEFKAAIAQSAMAQHTGQADLVRAQLQAQIAQVTALGQAQATLTTGSADVQLMALMQQHGLDPLKLKALEALQTFAETPSAAGGLISGDVMKGQIMGQIAAAALTGTGSPVQVPTAAPAVPLLAGNGGTGATAPASAPASPRVDDLRRQIDGLTARLAEGQLSEAMYTRLVDGLEARIRAAQGAP